MDSAVLVGTLSNGLRYYIRHNENPGDRAELRLAVDAGSVLEDPDQIGTAHFVEHMAFNGSTHFRKNELIHYLESIGMRFGADLNAHTGADETVYEITVPADSATLDKSLTILTDWAHGILFDSSNVVAERSVITEEWRLRVGVGTRVQAASDAVLYRGTPYPDRTPIGTVESVQRTNPSVLERFYADWYRPDLMTVVAVGDFDVRQMEREIQQRFGVLSMPPHPRARPTFAVDLSRHARVVIVEDPEQAVWNASLYMHRPTSGLPNESLGAYRASRVDNVFVSIVNQRLARLVRDPQSSVLGARMDVTRLQRGALAYRILLIAKPNHLESGITHALIEVERIAREGVSAGELDRVRQTLIRQANDAATTTGMLPSSTLANQYVQNALYGGVSLSPTQVQMLIERTLATVTVGDIQSLARRIQSDTAPTLIAAIPAKDLSAAAARPTSATILSAIAAVKSVAISPYVARATTVPLVGDMPLPGKVLRERTIAPIGVTEWILSNGIRVLLKPITGNSDKIFVTGWRPGGYVLADSADYPSAAAASVLVGSSGVASYSNDDLQTDFAGTLAGAGVNISDYAETASGQSGTRPDDITLMFQILYLKFTEPRIDTTYVARWKADAVHPAQVDPLQILLSDFLRNGHPFGRPVTSATADSVDAHRALAFYKSRFDDASGFTFAIAGHFTPAQLRPYVEQYLASLPVSGTIAQTRDLGVRARTGPIRQMLLTRDGDPQARTILVYTDSTYVDSVGASRTTAAAVVALSNILQERLTYTLRQKMGGVYVVQVDGNLNTVPSPRIQLQIGYTADPARFEELHRVLLIQLDSIGAAGPTDSELHDVRENVRRTLEVSETDPDAWAQRLINYVASGWPLETLATERSMMRDVTAVQVQRLARHLFVAPNCIEVASMPQRYLDAAHLPITAPSAPAAAPRRAATPSP